MHKESRKDTNKSGEESAEQSGDESGEEDEMGEDNDQENEENTIKDNVIELESTMSSHSLAFLAYSYTRLPCAAHKVLLDERINYCEKFYIIFYLSVKVHLVVDKSAGSKFLLFGETLNKARQFVLKYRKSSKAKSLLLQWFPRKLPGFVVTRW